MNDKSNSFKEQLLDVVKAYCDEKGLETIYEEINGQPAVTVILDDVVEYAPEDMSVTFTELGDYLYMGLIIPVEMEIEAQRLDDIEKLMPLLNNYLDTGGFYCHKDSGDLFFEQFWPAIEEDSMENTMTVLLTTVNDALTAVQDGREMLSRLLSGETTADELIETEEYITQ